MVGIYIYMQFSGFLGARQGVFGPFGLILISDPLGPGMPFLDSDTCTQGGVIYFCQGFLPCMMPSMDGWTDGSRDEKSFTTSFTICNN
jgi:hypothetical protein